MASALVVPCRRPDGSLASLQFITVDETAQRLKAKGTATKLSLPGHPLDGWHTVGKLVPGGEVFVCEGIGAAWACWRATGKPAVVCFGWGRVRGVSEALRQDDAAARLVLVPDVGKEAQAHEIAADVDAFVAEMPPGWPANSDVCDLAQRDGAEALAALLEAPKGPPQPWEEVDIADLDWVEPPPPEQVWGALVPAGVVTLFGAHGGKGKSLIGLMLCVCVALGRELFGIPTRQGVAVFYSGEDDKRVVRHRLKWLCRQMGVRAADLQGRLLILDASDADPTLYREGQGKGPGMLTPTYDKLAAFLAAKGAGLVVVDNASDAYDASEIDRAKVRAFIRALAKMARASNAGLVLLAHVDKGTSRGDRAGTEGYSGSTAWNNSARSRLFMREDGDGLVIEHQKANYSQRHEPLRLVWPHDRLPVLDGLVEPMVQGIADRTSTKVLLKLIHEFTQRGEFISTATTSRTHAAKMLCKEPGYPRLRHPEVFALLRRAERAGHLQRVTYRGSDRKERERWQVTTVGLAFADVAATAATTGVTALGAPAAEPAATAATSAARGVGKERAHISAGTQATGGLEHD
jgi:N-acetylmuramoyl-L-alanine amidase